MPARHVSSYQDESYAYPTIAADQNLNFTIFRDYILNNHFKSVDETLPPFSKRYPDFLQFNTLMYGSRSIQKSNFLEPRVLVFGPTGKFIFSFNGADQPGGNEFETLEYSDVKHIFQFREIVFKSAGFDPDMLDLKPEEIDINNDDVIISKANPQKCLNCHGQNASPMWAVYPNWPGAYGSGDDRLTLSFHRKEQSRFNIEFFKTANKPVSLTEKFDLKPGVVDAEVQGMIHYLEARPNDSRYKWLPERFSDEAFLRWSRGETFATLDQSDQCEAIQKKFHTNGFWPSRPNLFFQDLLIRLNQDRMLFVLEKKGLRDAFKAMPWNIIDFNFDPRVRGVAEISQLIFQTIAPYKFRGHRPSGYEITQALKANLIEEMGMQFEEADHHQYFFGPNSFHLKETPDVAYRRYWIRNRYPVYQSLMGWQQISETQKIALNSDSSDLVGITAVQFLLMDSGIDLHDYVMNIRQKGLNFFADGAGGVSGFNLVADFLGYPNKF